MHRVLQTFFAGNRLVRAGDLVSDTDPVIAGREHLFARLVEDGANIVEQATAAPGERRNAVIPPAHRRRPVNQRKG